MGDAETRTHEFSFSWPNEPLNKLRKRSDTIGEELCSVVLGTHEYEGERLSAVITDLGVALGLLYEQSPRRNFQGIEYGNGVFRAPKGEPNLKNIAVIQMEDSIHPPRHLRLMPRHWRKGETSGISRVEGLRDWAWYTATYAEERRSLITGYSIPFTEQGAVFIGLDLKLLDQWRDEVTNHHNNPPGWALRPFRAVIPAYNGSFEQLMSAARGTDQ